MQAQTQFILLTLTSYSYEKPLRLYQPQWLQTVDKVPVFAGTFTMRLFSGIIELSERRCFL